MDNSPPLTTGFKLPFEVLLGPLPLLGFGCDVDVHYEGAPGMGSMPELQRIFERFARLAATGALGSVSVPPPTSRIGDLRVSPQGGATIHACRIDERAALVLAHLFLAEQGVLVVRSLRLASRTGPSPHLHPLEHDPDEESTYPERVDNPSFELADEDPGGDSRTFTAEFERELEPEEAAQLTQALNAWADVVLAGGYALAPIPPEESYMEPEPPACWGSGFEYSVLKLRAAPQAVDGVVNIFAAFHHRVCRLTSLTIS